MTLRELYQQHYFHESERREQINNSIAIPLGIISVLAGALVIVAKEIDSPFDNLEKFQIVFIALTAISIVIATVFLIRSYWGYGYCHMPRAVEVEEYHSNLIAYYTALRSRKPKELAEQETLNFIYSEYAKNATKNAENNDTKSAILFKTNGFIILSIILLSLSATPYVYNSIIQPNETQKVEITNIKDLNMTNKNTPTNQGQQSPQPPAKPTPPPSRVIREHVEPPRKK